MRVALVTEAGTAADAWAHRLLGAVTGHTFHLIRLRVDGRRTGPAGHLPPHVASVRDVRLGGRGTARGRTARHAATTAGTLLFRGMLGDDQPSARLFADGLHRLATLARDGHHPLRTVPAATLLRDAVRAARGVDATLPVLTPRQARTAAGLLERAIRPLATAHCDADLTHATSAGPPLLAALAARWRDGTPFLLTEHTLAAPAPAPGHAALPGQAAFPGHAAAGHDTAPRHAGLPGHAAVQHGITPGHPVLLGYGAAPPGAGLDRAAARHDAVPGDDGVHPWNAAGDGDPVREVLARFGLALARLGYAQAAMVITGSRFHRARQLDLGADPARLLVVPPGVDDPGPLPEPPAPVLLWRDTIGPGAGLPCLISAFVLVRARVPGVRLLVDGPVADHRYAAACRDLARRLGLDGSLRFIDDPGADGQVAVATSTLGGVPYPLLQAMIAGRPAIAADIGTAAETVGDGGLVVPPRDPTAFAEAATRLLTDHALRRRTGEVARRHTLARHAPRATLAAYDQLYRDLGSP